MNEQPTMPDEAGKILVETTDHTVLVVQSNGTVDYCNQTGLSFFGLTTSMAGVAWPGILALAGAPANTDFKQLDVVNKVAELHKPRTVTISFLSTVSQEEQFLQVRYQPLSPPNDTKVLVVLDDKTIEHQVEQARSDFVSLASHQLRTPLSAIKWYLDIFLSHYKATLDKEQVRILNNIFISTERMIELIDALLNVSRIESNSVDEKPEPTELRKLIQELVHEMSPQTELKHITLVQSTHQSLPQIMIDPSLIRYVFSNLISNAIKYSDDGGEVGIFLSCKDDQILVQISDYGCGIPKSDQKRVFQKFFRSKNAVQKSAEGSGLGLYLSKTIVEMSGGSIWFESNEGQGTTFWFTIPMNPPKVTNQHLKMT